MRVPSFGDKAVMLVSGSLLIVQFAWGGTIEGRVHSSSSAMVPSYFVVSIEDLENPLPASKAPAVAEQMDQQGLRFVPHILAIRAGTTVEFPNSDPVSHNVFSISEAKRFNLGLYGRGMERSIRFDRPGVVELLCNVHMEMSGYVVVLRNPYFARPGPDGTYRIVGVPAGRHRIRCWHEKLPAQEREIDVPSEGTVNVDCDMRSSTKSNKGSR